MRSICHTSPFFPIKFYGKWFEFFVHPSSLVACMSLSLLIAALIDVTVAVFLATRIRTRYRSSLTSVQEKSAGALFYYRNIIRAFFRGDMSLPVLEGRAPLYVASPAGAAGRTGALSTNRRQLPRRDHRHGGQHAIVPTGVSRFFSPRRNRPMTGDGGRLRFTFVNKHSQEIH